MLEKQYRAAAHLSGRVNTIVFAKAVKEISPQMVIIE